MLGPAQPRGGRFQWSTILKPAMSQSRERGMMPFGPARLRVGRFR